MWLELHGVMAEFEIFVAMLHEPLSEAPCDCDEWQQFLNEVECSLDVFANTWNLICFALRSICEAAGVHP